MPIIALLDRCRILLALALAAAVAVHVIFFAAHVYALLTYPYPLDYGEGPLLAQVNLLRSGTPIWRLYADPALSPYAVVNYPPFFPLLAAALAGLVSNSLLAGRLLALLSTLGCVCALMVLAEARKAEGAARTPPHENAAAFVLRLSSFVSFQTRRQKAEGRHEYASRIPHPASYSLHLSSPVSCLPLLFLTIPVVREWAAVMRVDMLALCLGLWGLVVLTHDERRKTKDESNALRYFRPSSSVFRPLAAGLLFVLALFTKPSLLAAPVAGGVYFLLGSVRGPRLAVRLIVIGAWMLMGLLPLALLQWESGGWFWLHIVQANVNRWDAELAWQFWADQLRLRWPLFVSAVLSVVAMQISSANARLGVVGYGLGVLPILYTCVGALDAVGVGKVGAYANYFLELYAGLVWLVCYAVGQSAVGSRQSAEEATERAEGRRQKAAASSPRRLVASRVPPPVSRLLSLVACLLLLVSLLWYSPLWSREKLRLAGLLEPNPPQPAFWRNGLWRESIREREVLGALGRVQGALTEQVQAAGGPIFTDTPGIAAEAGVLTPLQAFEHRQLLDGGHWDQHNVLLGLANGEYPLAVIDFLGNWLTPQMVTLLTHRYAQDGSRGTFDLYRPVNAGPTHTLDLPIGDLKLASYALAPPGDSSEAYSPGELVPLRLDWERSEPSPPPLRGTPSPAGGRGGVRGVPLDVVVQLTDDTGNPLLELSHPLLYGALPPNDWPINHAVQHLEALALPKELPPGSYTLAVILRSTERDLVPPQTLARITVGEKTGTTFETGYYVPAPLLQTWQQVGGIERAGLPLTPAMPFNWGTLQCFELLCLEQRGAQVTQRPLGDLLFLGETLRNDATALREPFLSYWRSHGGEEHLGSPISGEIARNGYIVQWTRYARLEHQPGSDSVALGRLGDDSLRLSPGMKYRWPTTP